MTGRVWTYRLSPRQSVSKVATEYPVHSTHSLPHVEVTSFSRDSTECRTFVRELEQYIEGQTSSVLRDCVTWCGCARARLQVLSVAVGTCPRGQALQQQNRQYMLSSVLTLVQAAVLKCLSNCQGSYLETLEDDLRPLAGALWRP